jgi:hypothetical protein
MCCLFIKLFLSNKVNMYFGVCKKNIRGRQNRAKEKKRFLMLKVRRPGISYNDNIKTEKYFKISRFFRIKERGDQRTK